MFPIITFGGGVGIGGRFTDGGSLRAVSSTRVLPGGM